MDGFPMLLFGTGASAAKGLEELKHLVKVALESGIVGFDTAPSYHTEKPLAEALREGCKSLGVDRKKLFIQTKIDGWQMQEGPDAIKKYVEKVLLDMGLEYLDGLLIHWPIPEELSATWQVMVDLRQEQKVKHIGICNVRKRHLEQLIQWDIPPEMIQIERNPLLTFSEEIAFCKQQQIAVQAYSPLCKMDDRIKDNQFLNEIAEKYEKNVGQIVLRWHLDTGVNPIFTSRKESRIQEYSDIFGFSLTKDELEKINEMNIDYKLYLESFVCPGF